MIRLKAYVIKQNISRSKVSLAVCILMIMMLGLASRKYPFLFPKILDKYPGDALWSIMVYLGWAFLKPVMPSHSIARYAFFTSSLDELSQLIQTPWLDGIRHTNLGHLILGTVFSWSDIFAYSIGIIIAFGLDIIVLCKI